MREIVDLDPVRQVKEADALSPKSVGDDGDLVAHFDETLAQVILMHLDAADVRQLEVGHKHNVESAPRKFLRAWHETTLALLLIINLYVALLQSFDLA